MSFTSQVNSFVDKTENSWTKIFRGSALEIFKTIVVRSPVLTGRFINNWSFSINRPDLSLKTGKTKSRNKAIGYAKATTAIAKLGDKIYMTNNLPYADALEKGSSKKAPRGMVRTTLLKWRLAVRKMERINS